jgi:AcrR family transcriptional regulator
VKTRVIPRPDPIDLAASAEAPPLPAEPRKVPAAGREQLADRSGPIVEAAYELLATQGLEGLTIRAVLEKTGLARRAFYECFAGKDDLILAVFEQTISMAAIRFGEQIAALPDPLERLRVIVTCIVMGTNMFGVADASSSNKRSAALVREHLRLAESRPEDLQAALRPLITLLAKQLTEGMTAGTVRAYPAQRLAKLVYNVVSTTMHAELLADEETQSDQAHRIQLAEEIWEFCRRAIAA